MELPIVLSHFQTKPLLNFKGGGETSQTVSIDLGRTKSEARLTPSAVNFNSGESLSWETVEAISASPNNCFAIRKGEAEKVILFSPMTNRTYSLMPTITAPTMLLSGVPMHRIKKTDPVRDTLEKIKCIAPVAGEVLDTNTGLGYTAIEAAKAASHVTTIELDPAVVELARINPWSRELFDSNHITRRIGDSFEIVREFEDARFHRVIHDPPEFSKAGSLYSQVFYLELHRILQRKGRLFHYIGNPESPSGRRTTRGVVSRLKKAGFSRVLMKPAAFGVLAFK